MTTSVVPEPFRAINESARLNRLHGEYPRYSPDAKLFSDFILTFDPFQARTLPVFESIYRYGREMLS